MCPWHHCDVCGRRALRLCTECPNSFCPNHIEGNIFAIPDNRLVCSDHDDLLKAVEVSKLETLPNQPGTVVSSTTVTSSSEVYSSAGGDTSPSHSETGDLLQAAGEAASVAATKEKAGGEVLSVLAGNRTQEEVRSESPHPLSLPGISSIARASAAHHSDTDSTSTDVSGIQKRKPTKVRKSPSKRNSPKPAAASKKASSGTITNGNDTDSSSEGRLTIVEEEPQQQKPKPKRQRRSAPVPKTKDLVNPELKAASQEQNSADFADPKAAKKRAKSRASLGAEKEKSGILKAMLTAPLPETKLGKTKDISGKNNNTSKNTQSIKDSNKKSSKVTRGDRRASKDVPVGDPTPMFDDNSSDEFPDLVIDIPTL